MGTFETTLGAAREADMTLATRLAIAMILLVTVTVGSAVGWLGYDDVAGAGPGQFREVLRAGRSPVTPAGDQS